MRSRFPIYAVLGLSALGAACTSSSDQAKPITEVAGFTTRVGEPKPFVLEARPVNPDYLPVGVTVTRTARKKTAAEFKAIEQALDAAKGSNESAGSQARALGATPPPKPPPVPPPL